MRDPEFLAETEKAQLEINPLTGEEVREVVESLFDMDPEHAKKLSKILEQK